MSIRFILDGHGAARGMALGRARLVHPSKIVVDERPLAHNEIEREIRHLENALNLAREELTAMRDKLHGALAREVGEFLDAHGLILEDPELITGLFDLIRHGKYRASAALKFQRDRLVAVFDSMDDPYMRSRREDVDHVIGRVQEALGRNTSAAERQIAARVGEILIGDSVAPADMAHLSEHGVLGIITTGGSTLSHSAILARSLHVPMVVGARDALASVHEDDLVLMDGERGFAVVHPTAHDLARYRQHQRDSAREARALLRLKNAATVTRDGAEIRLFANAEMPADVTNARAWGADGIGLYRTEFLFLQRKELPSEDEQFTAYRDLVLGMGGLPSTLRTLDLGADKADSSGLTLEYEPNPALGLRGVRLSLRYPRLFATQLRAMLRASAYGPIRILVPMVSAFEEIVAVRTLLDRCAAELRSEGVAIADHFEFGAMIEVPAAAIALPLMIDQLDFVAIGTNDLVQYTVAADRGNDALGTLYDPLHPAVLRLIRLTIVTGKRARKPVSLCGEMAGDTRYTALLLALGLTDFSMHPGTLLEVRQAIAECDLTSLRKKSVLLLRARTRAEIDAALVAMQE